MNLQLITTHTVIPKFKEYYPSKEIMTLQQRQFYDYWLSNWKKGKKIPINGQISYIFTYVYDLLCLPFEIEKDNMFVVGDWPVSNGLKKDYKNKTKLLIKYLTKIIILYPEEEKLVSYLKHWVADCWILLGKYNAAFETYPSIAINEKPDYPTEEYLNLKLLTKQRVSGQNLLTLDPSKLTVFGRKNLNKVAEFLDILIKEKENKEKINLLQEWKKESKRTQFNIFVGTPHSFELKLPFYEFRRNKNLLRLIHELTIEAENTVREEMGIPKIGEGWVSETELYYQIKKSFPNLQVIHHARPKWLGRQHIDIFLPKIKIAIEYCGVQHYRPIEFFGGLKAFKANLRRDQMKKQKCIRNGVHLINVLEGYHINEIIDQINNLKSD